MNPDEYERMYQLEDWYWWFVARRHAALALLRDHAPPERPLRILDAGCGTGGLLDALRDWPDAEATGIDFSPGALAFCRKRAHSRLAVADVTTLPFASNTFDAVTALDVIEHVADDRAAVAEIMRVLRPGGIFVASVPAYKALWGPHDVALHHFRRYNLPEFRAVIESSGLRAERSTYLVSLLFPAAVASRLASRLRPERGAALPPVSPLLNRTLTAVQAMELAVARRVSLPYGLTVMVVARKPALVRAATPLVEEVVAVPAAAAVC